MWNKALEVKSLTSPGKLYITKIIAIFVSAFFPKLPYQESEDPTDWIILDVWVLLSFISVDILLAKAFFILAVCLVVRNNSCGSSSSWKFLLI